MKDVYIINNNKLKQAEIEYLRKLFNKYIPFVTENDFINYKEIKKEKIFPKEYELKITKKALKRDLSSINKKRYIHLYNRINDAYIFEKNGKLKYLNNKTVNTDDKYYNYIIDIYGNIFISKQYTCNKKNLNHSCLIKNSWPVLAGNIIIKNGIIKYIDEISGHFKPKNRVYIIKKVIKDKKIYSNAQIIESKNTPCSYQDRYYEIESVNDLLNLYKCQIHKISYLKKLVLKFWK